MLNALADMLAARLRRRRGFTQQEAAHADEVMRQRDLQLADGAVRIGAAFNAVTILCSYYLLPFEAYRTPLLACAGALFVVDLAWTLILHRQRLLKAAHILVVGNLFYVATFTLLMELTTRYGLIGAFVLTSSSTVSLVVVLIILSPFSNWRNHLLAFAYWCLPFFFYPDRPEGGLWIAIFSVAVVFACVIRQSAATRDRRGAVLEYRRREAEIRAAKVRFQHELELAREIQDSLAPPALTTTPEGMRVHCVQLKHEKVAGDWLSVRRFPDGSLVLVVADATGKGMQAALVVHAIQSLWATTLDNQTFDPKGWLELVNHALFRLGEKQTHSATIGLAVLKGSRITYWSAGHLPVFLLLGSGPHVTFKAIAGRGNVLGLDSSLQLAPTYIDVAPNYPVRVVLGSDGILPKGTLTLQRDVERIYEELKTEPEAFERIDTADDKTLIVLEKNYAPDGRGRGLAA